LDIGINYVNLKLQLLSYDILLLQWQWCACRRRSVGAHTEPGYMVLICAKSHLTCKVRCYLVGSSRFYKEKWSNFTNNNTAFFYMLTLYYVLLNIVII